MATLEKSFDAGLHSEQLSGRTQEIFFSAEEEANFVYPYNAFQVDSNKKTELDAKDLESKDINLKIRELMKEGFGHIVVQNPRAKHSISVWVFSTVCNSILKEVLVISAAAWWTVRISEYPVV